MRPTHYDELSTVLSSASKSAIRNPQLAIRRGGCLLATAFCVMAMSTIAFGVTKTSAGSGPWSTAGTWSPSGVPASGDTVVIANTHTVSLTAAATIGTGATATVTVQSGGVLDLSSFALTANTLTINNGGEVKQGGTGTAPSGTITTRSYASNSTYTFNGTQAGLSGTHPTYGNLNFAPTPAGAGSFGVSLTVAGTMTINLGAAQEIRFATATTARTHTITGDLNVQAGIVVGSNGSSAAGTATVTVGGKLNITGGTFRGTNDVGDATFNVAGNVINGGTWQQDDGSSTGLFTVNLNGGSAQDISGTNAISFENLTINNSAGVTLSRSVDVTGALTLTSGILSTNTNTLSVTNTATSAVARTTGYVNGNLQWSLPSIGSLTTYVFPLGTANGYSPFTLAVASTGGTTTFTASATQAVMPGVQLTGKALQKYWSLSTPGTVTATPTFVYLDADVPGTSTEANYRIFKDNNGAGTAFTFPDNGNDDVTDGTNTATLLTTTSTYSNWSVAEPNAPTAVKLMSFTATNNNGEVTLSWQSGYEAHNLGYIVYREQNGKREQITPSLIAGSALTTGLQTVVNGGLAYTWYDKASNQQSAISNQKSAATYWLEDVDLNGTRTLHGPIAIAECGTRNGDCKNNGAQPSPLLNEIASRAPASGTKFRGWAGSFGRQQASFSKASVVAQGDIEQQRKIAATTGIKLAVSTAGWQRVTQPELLAAGFDADANAAQLQLYSNGHPVAIKVSGDQVHLTATDYVEFYGHGLDSPTDAAQTYYLVVKPDGLGTRITDAASRDRMPLPSGAANYQYTIERRDRWIYYSAYLNGEAENVFGHIVRSTPVDETLPVGHPDLSGGDAQLEVSLVGVSLQAHQVRVSFNGTEVGTIDFANGEHPTQTFNVPAALLVAGDNTVQLRGLGGDTDASLVDTIRLTYAHRYEADNNVLSLGVNTEETKRVGGFTSGNIRAVDITDLNNVLELTPAMRVTVQSDGTYAADLQVRGAATSSPHTVLVFAEGTAAHPDSVKANQASSWSSRRSGADYAIITSGDFVSQVEPLAALRRSQGLVVNVIDVEDLYDEFSYGRHTPQAIHDYLEQTVAPRGSRLHYVLFAGDSSFDPKNYLGQGNTDYVPTKLIDTALMETASDDWLADFDHDGLADLSIGRLPLRTAADADLMVGKIISYEQTAPDPQRGALLVADRDFEASSSAVQSLLPAGMPQQVINRSSADDATIHSQIMTSLNQGPRLVNFMGHGGNGTWTGAMLLSIYDAPDLTNTNRLSVFTMMTCMNGYFQNAYVDSLGEALLRNQGGAVAVWASTGMTEPGGQNLIDQEFYRQMFGASPARLGDAVHAAKQTTGDADVRRTWILFGDPAMRLSSAAPTAAKSTVVQRQPAHPARPIGTKTIQPQERVNAPSARQQ